MQRICKKCKLEISPGIRAMVCEGFCEDICRFHLECVGMTIEYADACQHKNVMWMCDCCRDLMENVKFRNTVNKLTCDAEPQKADSELDQLKQEIRSIHTSLVELSDIVKNGRSKAHSELENSPSSLPRNVLSSTPAQNETSSDFAEDTSNFELFLSNIAPDVTEEDVSALVRDTLKLFEPIRVKRLVPGWRDVTTLDFVSFKVRLKEKHRTNALDTTVWPTGIRCREFRNYSPTAWRPIR